MAQCGSVKGNTLSAGSTMKKTKASAGYPSRVAGLGLSGRASRV